MTKVFGEKLNWEHVAIIALVLAIVYFIWKHNGIKGAYDALLSDVGVHPVDPTVKKVKGKHTVGCHKPGHTRRCNYRGTKFSCCAPD